MIPLEPHPEALLERARRGVLAPEETELLEAHLGECPACALELEAASLFRSALAPRDEDAALDLQAVERAMAIARPLGGLRRVPWSVRIGLAAILMGGLAAGAYTLRGRWHVQPVALVPTSPVMKSASGPAPVAAPEPALRVEATSPAPSPRVLASRAAAPRSPAELFAQANQARRNGLDDEAVVLYRELQHTFPDSREAQLSQATLAQLLLDRGQADQALAGFDRYLHGSAAGPVTEDALVGRATALAKLGKRAEERATWQELLARFPASIHASRARARLAELR